jgi:hypothetical protein
MTLRLAPYVSRHAGTVGCVTRESKQATQALRRARRASIAHGQRNKMATSSIARRGGMKPRTPPSRKLERTLPEGSSSRNTAPTRSRLHPQPHPRRADPIAWPPLPGSLIGMPKANARPETVAAASILMDQMAERLAFERCATQIYEAMLEKLASTPSNQGLSHEVLRRFRDEEAAHFEVLCEAIESLGGDPLAPTASADAIGAEASALLAAIKDPRASLARCLNTLLVAELADHAGWEALFRVAQECGQDALAERLYLVLQEETEQVHCVKHWRSMVLLKAVQAAA